MLTAKAITAAGPGKHFDGGGLYLEVTPKGARLWRLKYRHGGKEKRISFGAFPEVSLKEARDRRADARQLLRNGIDPSAQRQEDRRAATGADTFEAVAREWFATKRSEWVPAHGERQLRRLEVHVFPMMGRRPLAEITPPEALAVLRRIEERGTIETAHRVFWIVGEVFRFGVQTGRCASDPTRDLRGALRSPPEKNHAAITEPKQFGALLRAIDSYMGQPTTAWALRLAPLVFVRPGELRQAEWSEIDLDAATWTIPAAKMKLRRDHVVPLAAQAVAIFREAHVLTGRGRYVFPSLRGGDRPMSNNTLNAALKRLGYGSDDAVAHGFRATARTMLDEVLHFRPDFIEHQLAHRVQDANGRAYNRTSFLPERREMMQAWANFLDDLRKGADVVPLRQAGA
ncbi:MAG TPA: integrase arm-type DNA-binding domain-containing protein [Vulgatibacter sp.]|nr:integrase arm-type DNA-binding domain-containing protein [Vulgatibacter sp.]